MGSARGGRLGGLRGGRGLGGLRGGGGLGGLRGGRGLGGLRGGRGLGGLRGGRGLGGLRGGGGLGGLRGGRGRRSGRLLATAGDENGCEDGCQAEDAQAHATIVTEQGRICESAGKGLDKVAASGKSWFPAQWWGAWADGWFW